MSQPTHAYLGRCKTCGRVSAMSVDMPYRLDDCAYFVATMIRDGLEVNRVTLQEARASEPWCECNPSLPDAE